METKKYNIKLRVWIEGEEGAFLGIGRIFLLENIKKNGSISNAAKKLKMSYRQAWQLVKEMNERASNPLVEIKLGGSGGGGAFVTPEGEKAIKFFYFIEDELKEHARKLMTTKTIL